jgi:phospholipase/carboxylesterase
MKRPPSSSPIRPECALRGALGVSVVLASRSATVVFAGLGVSVAVGCQASPSARAGGATSAAPSPVNASAPKDTEASKPTHPALSLEYLEAMTGGAANGAAEPLIVALHGLGGSPGNFITLFEAFPVQARVIAPHSHTAFGDGFEWFAPYGAVSDESAPALGKAADDVAAFIDQAAKAVPTLGKPIVIGFSQGGALSFTVAVRHPSSVAASFPISGWLPPPLWPSALPSDPPPIFAFHGTADQRVPLERDQNAVTALKKLGFPVQLTVTEGVQHVITDEVRQKIYTALATKVDEQRRAGAN